MDMEQGRRDRLCEREEYSNSNLWGRSNECGVLEDPWNKPPEDAYDLTSNIADAPDEAEEFVLTFKGGLPTAINGASYDLDDLIIKLNEIAGALAESIIAHFKPVIEQKFAEQVYNGLWYKGNVTVTGRRSDNSLYNEKLATYTNEDAFNQDASVGFIEIFGLPTKVKSMLESGG